MRIYFSGSHSSGKSTLARYVSGKYSLPMITECARAILSEQELLVDALRSDINIVNKYQTDVFKRQLEEEKKHNIFVSDRSLIDCLSYSFQHSGIGAQLMCDPMLKDYLEALKEPSSIIFFVRPSKATLKDDGVRESLTWDGIIAIDAMVKLLLEMFEIRYFQINTDSMQERIRIIDNIISLV